MENLAQIKHEWAQALDAEFNPAALATIHARYLAAKAQHAEWSALYEQQRAIVAEEREAARETAWEAHAQMSKGELVVAAGYTWTPQRTKRELLQEIADRAAQKVENEHSRVARIWRERSVEGRGNKQETTGNMAS